MPHKTLGRRLGWFGALVCLSSIYACGSDDSAGDDATNSGSGGGIGVASGGACKVNGDCASGKCMMGTCALGKSLGDGLSCASDSECASGDCTSGVCGGPSSGSGGSTSTSSGGSSTSGGGTTSSGGPPGFCVLGALGCPCDVDSTCAPGLSCNGTTCCDGSDCTAPTSSGSGGTSSGYAGAGQDPACPEGVTGPIITDCGYPFESDNPLTSIEFNESEVLRAIFPSGGAPLASVRVFYNDEHALTLGVRTVEVVSASGNTSTDYDVSPLDTNPDSVRQPATGTNLTSGDQSGLDPSGRPMWPALFVTDITDDANSRAGDWQEGGHPYNPNVIFGSWKGAVRTVDTTVDPNVTSITPDADPSKNDWDLGTGADPVPDDAAAQKNEGFGAEARWDLVLVPGRNYRIQVMVHDGDQNKVGGDSGEACITFCAAASCPDGSLPCSDDSPCPITSESVCVSGCCL